MRANLVILLILLIQSCQTINKQENEIQKLPTPKCIKPAPVKNSEFRLVNTGYVISEATYKKIIAKKPLELTEFVFVQPGFYISVLTYDKLGSNTKLLTKCIHSSFNVIKSTWQESD